jgi:hypothetical protein
VDLLTVATGAITTGDRSDEKVEISLANAAFTQRAGENVLVIAESDWDVNGDLPEGDGCEAGVVVGSQSGPPLLLEMGIESLGVSLARDIESLAPSDSDIPVTLGAGTSGDGCPEASFTIGVTVAVVALR